MQNLKWFIRLLWRGYYYLVVFLGVLFVAPGVVILVHRRDWYPAFYEFARFWGKWILFWMGFRVDATGSEHLNYEGQAIFVANHQSEIDIMSALAQIKRPIVFIGKIELARFPIFGYFYRKSSILVDRSSPASRREVYETAKQRLEAGEQIFIYAEGGVPEPNVRLAPFKMGAFRLSAHLNIPIIPITFVNHTARFPYSIEWGSPGVIRTVIHPPEYPSGTESRDIQELKDRVRKKIEEPLIAGAHGN
jgi:1-acyl-sn-glycerol-3-phosphate acyltransferase